ncbi:MAG: CinA family protein, partial [Oscillospiraceae bacterium]
AIISIREGEDDALIRVVCSSKDEIKAKEQSYKIVKRISEMFSDYVYGIDIKNNMQAAVNEILCKEIEFSFADGYTRGVLSRRFKEAHGFKEAFIGYTIIDTSLQSLVDEGVSPSLVEKNGSVSDEVATALAYSNLCFNHSDIAIGIVGYGPKRGKHGKVIVSICDENQCQIHHIDIKDNGLAKDAEDIACDKIINIIRVFAKEYPQFKNSKNIKLFMGDYIRDTYTKKEKIKPKQAKGQQEKKSYPKNMDFRTIYSPKEQTDEVPTQQPVKKKRGFGMRKFFQWFMLTCCALCLVGSIGYILYYFGSSDNAKSYYDELAQIHISENSAPDATELPTGYPSE